MSDSEPEQVPNKRRKTVDIKREVPSPEPEQSHVEPAVPVESPYLEVETTRRQLLAYETGYLTDVTILAHNEKIQCHSQILSFASPKLAAMLCGGKKEFRISGDVEPGLVRLLLQIIYSGKTSQKHDMDTLLQLGLAAHKLQIHAATVYSCLQLGKLVTIRTLFRILEFAYLVGYWKLIEACSQVIQRDAAAVLQTEGFLKCKQSTLLKILDLEGLRNVTELQIFDACKRWAIANSADPKELRETLGKVVHKIRFLALGDSRDFTKHVCSSGLLTVMEERDIMYCLLTGQNSSMPRRFTNEATPRDQQGNILQTTNIELKYRDRSYLSPNSAPSVPLRFSLNRDTHIQGVRLRALGECKRNRYKCSIEISLRDKEGMVLTFVVFEKYVRKNDSIEVKFARPYAVFAGQVYTLYVNIIDTSDRSYPYCHYEVMTKVKHDLQLHVLEPVWLPAYLIICFALLQ